MSPTPDDTSGNGEIPKPGYEVGATYSYLSIHGHTVTWTKAKDGLWWSDDGRPEFATDADVAYSRATPNPTPVQSSDA